MTPTRLDILTEGLSLLARVIMSARSDHDAAALVERLRGLGPAERADVAAVFTRARERLGWVLDPATQKWGHPPDEAVRASRAVFATGVEALDICTATCDQGSPCLLQEGHAGGHETQHGCIAHDPLDVGD